MKKLILLFITCLAMLFMFDAPMVSAKVPLKKTEFNKEVKSASLESVFIISNYALKHNVLDVGIDNHQRFNLDIEKGGFELSNDAKPNNRYINGVLNEKSEKSVSLTNKRQ